MAYVIKEAKKINRLEHLLGGREISGSESWRKLCLFFFFLRRKKKIKGRKSSREKKRERISSCGGIEEKKTNTGGRTEKYIATKEF